MSSDVMAQVRATLPAHVRANQGTVHVNKALSDFATLYENGAYIADFICPPIPVDKWSDTFFTHRLIDVITPDDDRISPRGEVSEINYQSGTDTYTVVDRGKKGYVPWQELENSDDPLMPRERQTSLQMNQVLLNTEVRVADFLNTSTNYAAANRITAGAAWSDETTGDPVKDIQSLIAALAVGGVDSTEVRMAMALELWQECQRHPKVTGLLGANDRGLVSISAFEEFFGAKLIVSDAQKNTAARDAAGTVTKSRIWDTDKVVCARVPTGTPTKETMMLSGRFRKRLGTENDVMVVEWQEPGSGAGEGQIGLKTYRGESDPKALQNDMGAILLSA